MSLQIAAQHLASKGRNGDSMLVHMTPGEVAGLQALAMAKGGSLSINPDTGLVEANFLKSLLPTLVGVGLSFIPGVGPVMAGMMTGAFETARTGDLGKGIMAGLGAYGGAGLGNALAASGASNLAQTAASNIDPAMLETMSAEQVASQATSQAGIDPTTFGGKFDLATKGAQNLVQPTSLSNFGENLSTLGKNLDTQFPSMTSKMAAAAPVVSAVGEATAPKPFEPPKYEKSDYKGPYYPAPREVRFPRDRSPDDSSEFSFFTPTNPYPGYQPFTAAQGGLLDLQGYAEGGVPLDNGGFVVDARTVSEIGNGSSNAGLERLAKLGARPVRGPGDGTSDSVKANIGGVQEARVARDEAVFDANAVKRLGGGNPKKGAKKLYALMNKAHAVRKQAKRGENTGLAALMA